MARESFAKRYAQAIFEIALEQDKLDAWASDMSTVAGVVGDAVVAAFLESPKFHFDDKHRLLSEHLKGINPLVLNLVYLLITKGRLGIFSDIVDEYHRVLDKHRGIERAEAITAVPLDDEDKAKLTRYLGAVVDRKVALTSEVDPGLLGGVSVRIGGKLMDGSTRSQLAALRREMVGAG